MILIVEIAMLCMGLYLLIKGKLFANKDAKFIVRGWPVRVMGIFYVLPIPLSLLTGAVLGVWGVTQGKDVADPSFFWVRTAIDWSILAVCMLAARIVSRLNRIPVDGSQAESTQTAVSLQANVGMPW